jgi:hypothetical protein
VPRHSRQAAAGWLELILVSVLCALLREKPFKSGYFLIRAGRAHFYACL